MANKNITKKYYLEIVEQRGKHRQYSNITRDENSVVVYVSQWQKHIIKIAGILTGNKNKMNSKANRKRLFAGEWLECDSKLVNVKHYIRVRTIKAVK